MRLQVKHVEQLAKDVAAFRDGGAVTLIKACDNWTKAVRYNYDADTTAWRRDKLIKELADARLELAAIYDLMGERGMLVK